MSRLFGKLAKLIPFGKNVSAQIVNRLSFTFAEDLLKRPVGYDLQGRVRIDYLPGLFGLKTGCLPHR